VTGRSYLMRQATTLIKFAKSVKDPQISAALAGKAADLKDRVDENLALPDWSLRAPDVEPPASS
jgi:hypothetical protein